MSGDGHHLTSPKEDGQGALLAMNRALNDAKLDPQEVTYVNAHATSTPRGDVIELKAIQTLFKNQSNTMLVSSTKGSHGHLLGAAGNLEAAFTIRACHEGVVPPNVNLDEPCEEARAVVCPREATEWRPMGGKRRVAVKNSFGFGGTNASLCIAEYR
uniref:beta-ketoacyl-[acyl-carrier-protein] synthase I n=1 Tax=Cacopsylla melanoneura TaxID=428564 RepID=A0A8D9ASZ9_9HEMI